METIVETESVKVNLQVKVWPKASSSSFLSSVVISINRETEEFLIDENENNVRSLGTYSDPSSPTDSLTLLEFQNFEPNYVSQVLHDKLHDHLLSEQISNQIVDKAQEQRRNQSFDTPLSVAVSVKLTQKVYNVVPCYSSPPSTRDFEKQNEEESETCSICLENLLVFGSEEVKRPICQMPNCSHLFHEDCVIQWLNRLNNSCPLCRQPVCEQQE